MMQPRFLLCPPDHFSVDYAINPYMQAGASVDRALARSQWEFLRDTLRIAGAVVEVQRPVAGLPDMVFTNNAALVYDGRALLTRFRHDERRGEQVHNARTLKALGIDVMELPPEVEAFEGMAEVVVFDGRAVCAVGDRTSIEAIPYISAFLGDMPTVPVHLVDPRFYHLDVAFCPLDERRALVVPDAFDALSLRRLYDVVPEPIELTIDEALAFCGNAVVVGNMVLMNEVSPRLEQLLADMGFAAVQAPASEFLKSGGSLRCLSLRLDLTTTPVFDGLFPATVLVDTPLTRPALTLVDG